MNKKINKKKKKLIDKINKLKQNLSRSSKC